MDTIQQAIEYAANPVHGFWPAFLAWIGSDSTNASHLPMEDGQGSTRLEGFKACQALSDRFLVQVDAQPRSSREFHSAVDNHGFRGNQ